MAQITWERSLDVLGAAQKVMVDTLKLIAVPGSGALESGDALLDASWGSLKQSFRLAEDAYVAEAEKREVDRKTRLAGLSQTDLPLPPGERSLLSWKNDQTFAVKAWEEGETAGPVLIAPGEEMTCFNPAKVAWTMVENPEIRGGPLPAPPIGNRRKKSARVQPDEPIATAVDRAGVDALAAPALEEEPADAPA